MLHETHTALTEMNYFSLHICSYTRSEANDLALRLAQQYTQQQDVVVLDQ